MRKSKQTRVQEDFYCFLPIHEGKRKAEGKHHDIAARSLRKKKTLA
jgi:hypothetical protein